MENVMQLQRRMERHHRRSEDVAKAIRRAVEGAHDAAPLQERLIPVLPPATGGGTGNGNGNGGGNNAGSNPPADPKTTAQPSSTKGGSDYPGGFQPGPGGGQGSTTREQPTTTARETSSTKAPEPTTTSTSSTSTPEPEPTTTRTRTVSATQEITTKSAASSTSSKTSTTAAPTSTMSTSFSFSASGPPTTSVRYVTSNGLLLPTSTGLSGAAASGTASTDSSSNGPGVGPIIGIVAGALAGVAILAVLIGFIVRKLRNKEDPYEANPFDKDEFRRHSAMIPDTFESEDGHGRGGMPPMSEHYNNFPPAAGGAGGYESGMAGAGLAGAIAAGGLAAGAGSAYAHNETGGPRPPTMFERHINGPAAQYNASAEAPPMPQVGAIYSSAPPSMPSMAYGGGDPYSIAGVGRSRGNENLGQLNSVNPYAHLDRAHSEGGYQGAYSDLDRNGSHGSGSSGAMASGMPMHPAPISPMHEQHDDSLGQFDTAGRPGTAEGRSGTPDIPNVQQTYALGGEDEESGVIGGQRVASPIAMAEHQYLSGFGEGGFQAQQQLPPSSQLGSPQQQPLQIRNLMPAADSHHPGQPGARPYSTASSVGADPDDAYGGVY